MIESHVPVLPFHSGRQHQTLVATCSCVSTVKGLAGILQLPIMWSRTCVWPQDLQYSSEAILGSAPTWPQMAACLPSGTSFDWEGDAPLQHPLEQLVIYELHVRGFTQHPSAAANAPGQLLVASSCPANLCALQNSLQDAVPSWLCCTSVLCPICVCRLSHSV